MKKFRKLISVLAVSLLLLSFTSYAAEMWSEEYYRATDTTGLLTDDQQTDLDDRACEFVEFYGYDIVMASVSEEDIETTLYAYAEELYLDCEFGYGEDRDGVIMAFNVDTKDLKIARFGAAEEVIVDDFIEDLEEHLPDFYDDYSVYGPMYAFEEYMIDYMTQVLGYDLLPSEQENTIVPETPDVPYTEPAIDQTGAETAGEILMLGGEKTEEKETSGAAGNVTQTETKPEGAQGASAHYVKGGVERVGKNDQGLPEWYPVNLTKFKFYNDPDAPRIVDNADIFSPAEEAVMMDRIREYVPELGKDIVIYTENSVYGLGRDIFTADFYDFNGYGIGPKNEGVCLMICMDPDDRGWWAQATGPESRALYTEAFANELDEELYYYMKAGAYGVGVIDWIDNVHTLYTKGMPFAPDWFPDSSEKFVRTANPDAPRIVDSAEILSEEDEKSLAAQAKALSDELGIDVVIHTTDSLYNMSYDEYGEKFFLYNGYGLGDNFDGVLLTMFYGFGTINTTNGGGLKHFTNVNRNRIEQQSIGLYKDGYYRQSAEKWLDNVRRMEKKGRVPRTMFSWMVSIIAALLAGFCFGGGALASAKRKMMVIRLATNADAYVDGTPVVIPTQDLFLRTRVSTRHIERTSSSSRSSSGSSRSSYSSSYRGSSGRSHSGSGRSF